MGSSWCVVVLRFVSCTGSTTTEDIFRGTDFIENLQMAPRIIKTHFPVQFMPKSVWDANCKVSDLCVILKAQGDSGETFILNIRGVFLF